MAVDRGGLQYQINIGGDWRTSLPEAQAGIRGVRAEWEALKKTTGTGSLTKPSKDAQKAANDVRQVLTAEKARGEQASKTTKQLSSLEIAERRYAKAIRESAIQRQVGEVAARRAFALETRILTANQQRAAAERRVSKIINERATAQANLEAAQQRGISLSTAEAAKLKILTGEALKLARAKERLANLPSIDERAAVIKAQRADRSALDAALGVPQTAQQKAQASIQEILRKRAQTEANLAAVQASGIKLTAKEMRTLGLAAQETERRSNSLGFSLSRLVKVVLTLAVIRTAVQGFRELVRETVQFNARIEQAQLGIASLFSAVGDVRDAQGNLVTGAEALTQAQKEARRQTQLLRGDALKTTASFEDLVETFQVAVAPGLGAGLNIDQIRQFAVRISQAAQAIGLSQNQLAEEIRSILTGTIQQRTTRIAVALGITNEDIRRAKEAGTLVDFLQSKFNAFGVAGEESLNTFNGLLNRVRNGVQVLLQSGGLDFFESLKDLLRDTFSLISRTDDLGIPKPDPTALRAVEAIAAGLKAAVDEARRLQTTLTSKDIIAGATTIGQVLTTFAKIFGAIIEGLVKGLRDIQPFASVVTEVFKSKPVLDFLKVIARVLVVVGPLLATFKILRATTVFLIGDIAKLAGSLVGAKTAAAGMAKAFAGLRILFATLLSPAGLLAGAMVTAAVFAKQWLDNIAGIELSIGRAVKLMQQLLAESFAFSSVQADLGTSIKVANLELRTLLRLQEQGRKAGSDTSAIDAQIERTKKQIAGLEDSFKNLSNLSGDQSAKTIQQIADEQRAANEAAAAEAVAQAKKITDAMTAGPESLSKALEEIPAIISRGVDEATLLGNLVTELRDNTISAREELQFGLSTIGLEGDVKEQLRAAFETAVKFRTEGKKIATQQAQAEAELLQVRRDFAANEVSINNLTAQEQQQVQDVYEAYATIKEIEQELLKNKAQIVDADLDVANATEDQRDAYRLILNDLKQQRVTLEQSLQSAKSLADSIFKGKDPARDKQVRDIALANISLQGRLLSLQAQGRDLTQARNTLENSLNEELSNRLLLLSQEQKFLIDREQRLARVAALNAQTTAGLDKAPPELQNLGDRLNELRTLQAETLEVRKLRDAEEQHLTALLAQSNARLTNLQSQQTQTDDAERLADLTRQIAIEDQAHAAIAEQLTSLQARNVQLREKENVELDKSIEKLTEARNVLENPVQQGFIDGLVSVVQQLPTIYRGTMDAVLDITRGSTQIIGDEIANAFTGRQVNILNAFSDLFRQVAANLITALLNSGVVALIQNFLPQTGVIAGAAALSAASVELGVSSIALQTGAATLLLAAQTLVIANSLRSPIGFHSGGPVSSAHRTARGYRTAGRVQNRPAPRSVRPAGLHPRDTVPAWLDPSEWVIRGTSVSKYGSRVMAAINEGLIDPGSLKALAGLHAPSNIRPRPSLGFADGGPVAAAAETGRASKQRTTQAPAASTAPQTVVAYIPPSEETADRLLRGGINSVERIMDELGYSR